MTTTPPELPAGLRTDDQILAELVELADVLDRLETEADEVRARRLAVFLEARDADRGPYRWTIARLGQASGITEMGVSAAIRKAAQRAAAAAADE